MTQLLLVAAKLNVADELAAGPQLLEELARMAGNGRLKCLERKFASITRRECDDLDL
ncbi:MULTISPECIES: hypothetical protein [Rhizobium]|uniref:Uncharacterized protein n=2 Tax=Rhizobium TaxID=379 RepID=A0A6N9ZLJ4_9HYPH|nr:MULTISPECIES: hypothetical protein [Rhizobium]MBY5534947.1 hypothetical protein [Rhizobium leguminosarum]MBY5550563.1 hypothetical protein [Rhizobium leguminosarum]MBY5588743.1 hypothetical protein [Rhizobium leguminosarum]MBY5598649.1 hypothetical protein [Rhizobium leguminosarum]MBY5600228.1 hypothetical protein [Rhizobium leguminosarum]